MPPNHNIALIFELVYSFVPNCKGDGGSQIANFGGKNPPVHLIIIRE